MTFFSLKHGVIPACDVDTIGEFTKIVNETNNVKGIVGYKIGKILQTNYCLEDVLWAVNGRTDKPIILDPQKEGNDVEFTEPAFIKNYSNAGVKAMILFPFSSPRVQATCVKSCHENNILPIGGFRLTQKGFDETEEVELSDICPSLEGKYRGYISANAEERALQLYAKMGVDHFIGPGNKVEELKKMKSILKSSGVDPNFCMPGIKRQGGDISSAFEAVSDCAGSYAIIGSGIYKAENMGEAAEQFCEEALKFE